MPNNVELCRQNVMQGVSLAVQFDSDGEWMVCTMMTCSFMSSMT